MEDQEEIMEDGVEVIGGGEVVAVARREGGAVVGVREGVQSRNSKLPRRYTWVP